MTNDDLAMSGDAAAKFVGVLYPTFKRIVASGGGPPATMIGKLPSYRPSHLRAWIDSRAVKPGAA
jgi:hypothetical protein